MTKQEQNAIYRQAQTIIEAGTETKDVPVTVDQVVTVLKWVMKQYE